MFNLIETNWLFGFFFIFFARVCDVSLDVFRLLMLTRGYAPLAAAIGFVEVSIFIVALGAVMSGGVHDPVKVIAYAGGFATGNLVGSFIEGKMAFGYVAAHVYPAQNCTEELRLQLCRENFGVTKLAGQGRYGDRNVLIITVKRKDLAAVMNMVSQLAPDAFVSVSDIRSIYGGVFPQRYSAG